MGGFWAEGGSGTVLFGTLPTSQGAESFAFSLAVWSNIQLDNFDFSSIDKVRE
jgi:hypothetical protein